MLALFVTLCLVLLVVLGWVFYVLVLAPRQSDGPAAEPDGARNAAGAADDAAPPPPEANPPPPPEPPPPPPPPPKEYTPIGDYLRAHHPELVPAYDRKLSMEPFILSHVARRLGEAIATWLEGRASLARPVAVIQRGPDDRKNVPSYWEGLKAWDESDASRPLCQYPPTADDLALADALIVWAGLRVGHWEKPAAGIDVPVPDSLEIGIYKAEDFVGVTGLADLRWFTRKKDGKEVRWLGLPLDLRLRTKGKENEGIGGLMLVVPLRSLKDGTTAVPAPAPAPPSVVK
jgi:hypothetical protein